MNKSLTNLLITLLISIALGLIGYFSYGNFIAWFGISLVGQFLFFFLWNSTLALVIEYKMNRALIERQNMMDENRMPLSCASCGHINEALIAVNSSKNSFKCEKCGVENGITLAITNAQKTDIVYKDQVLTQEDIQGLSKK